MPNNIKTQPSMPKFIYLILASTVIASFFGTIQLFTFNLQGWAWVLQLLISCGLILKGNRNIKFPWQIWLPWVLVHAIYLPFNYLNYNALQRTLMIILPVLVGSAVSTYFVDDEFIKRFLTVVRNTAFIFFVVTGLIKSGVISAERIPEFTFQAAEAMSASIYATCFAVEYVTYGRSQFLFYWIIMCLIPFIAMTRTAIIAVFSTLPLNFAPFAMKKRLWIILTVTVLAVGVFYSDRFQQKTFWSGSGVLSDVRLDNPNFRSSGRSFLWERLDWEIEQKPWFGHGSNAQEAFVEAVTGGDVVHPHNDWKRLLFDYGYFGAVIFALCLLLQAFHALKMANQSKGATQMLFYMGASAFIPFVMLMFTDNIIIYSLFFGNLQFTILGMAYAAKYAEENKSPISDDINVITS